MDLLDSMFEYFYGTNSKIENDYYIAFLRSWESNPSVLKSSIKRIKRRRLSFLTFGKWIPNVIIAGSFTLSYSQKNPLYLSGMIYGEIFRNMISNSNNKKQETNRNQRNFIIKREIENERISQNKLEGEINYEN